jgi:hypothetical protein
MESYGSVTRRNFLGRLSSTRIRALRKWSCSASGLEPPRIDALLHRYMPWRRLHLNESCIQRLFVPRGFSFALILGLSADH